MKKLLCLVLVLGLILACSATAWAFTDTEELTEDELLALEYLMELEVVSGYPDDTFRPAARVNRAEFAKMLCMLAGESQMPLGEDTFTDVAPEAWYAGWVARANQQEWIRGYPEGEYRPLAEITQQEIATVLLRLSGISTEDFVWPDDYVAAAEERGYFNGLTLAAETPASRLEACLMLYNAAPAQGLETGLVQGVILSVAPGQIMVMNTKGQSTVYEIAAGLLPEDIFPGAYVEAQAYNNRLIKLEQVFNAKREAAYWDLAVDGNSALIDGKKYNIEEAEIYIVSYSLNKPYSAATFTRAGMIDKDILSLGGRMAAEMGVILEEENGLLKRAYLVNASVVISGGRLDVVEGGFSSAKGHGVSFLGRGGGLPLASGITQPPAGDFIHYNIRNGEISGWTHLYNPADAALPDVTNILKGGTEDAPIAWVQADGSFSAAALSTANLPKIIELGSGRNTVQLGSSENTCRNYFLAAGCLVYEVEGGTISAGSKGSMEKGYQVVALVNQYSEISYLFCIIP